jgi:hypothetical protein
MSRNIDDGGLRIHEEVPNTAPKRRFVAGEERQERLHPTGRRF